jgi:hypothetical protein
MRRRAGFAAAIFLVAGVLRCASFGSGTTTLSSADGGADVDAPVADGSGSEFPDGASADASDAPPTFYCPTEAGSCVFDLEVCCVKHSTATPFAAGDVLTAECITPGAPCVGASGAVTLVKCDRSDLCRGASGATADDVCCMNDGSEMGCVRGSCSAEVCQRSATVRQCADASAECGLVNSAQGGLPYGLCE